MYYKSTLDVKLKVKPVGTSFLHHTPYEGVCRTGTADQLTLDYDKAVGLVEYNKFLEHCEELKESGAEIMKPSYIPIYDDFQMSRETVDAIADGLQPQDAVIFSGTLSQHPLTKFAMRYPNQVAMFDAWHVDGTAFLRSIGRQCYGAYTVDSVKRWVKLLRVKKALGYMRVLNVEKGGHLKVGLKSSIYDLVDLEKRFGVEFVTLTSDEVLDMYDKMETEHPDWVEESRIRTKLLMEKAEKVCMTEEYVHRSVMFYVLIKKLLEKYECNAFSMPCREVCAGGTLMGRKMVFCLAHSLLKDEGIVTSCEGDLSALMGTAVLMNLARKAPHMGNNLLDNYEKKICVVHHDVPCVHMKGFDAPELPYALANFTVAGWGASMRYDFSQNIGEELTLLKFDPAAKKMMAIKGTIVAGDKYSSITEGAMHAALAGELVEDSDSHTKPGCSMIVKYTVKDIERFCEVQKNYGHHFAIVFGDHTEELRQLAEVLDIGIDVVV